MFVDDINFHPIISGVESDRKTHRNITENKKEKWTIHKISHLKSYSIYNHRPKFELKKWIFFLSRYFTLQLKSIKR